MNTYIVNIMFLRREQSLIILADSHKTIENDHVFFLNDRAIAFVPVAITIEIKES